MKFYLTIFALLFLAGCRNNEDTAAMENKDHTFYVGTYTDGDSQGIYKYSLSEDGHLKKTGLAATAENPSFLALSPDKRFLLAVNETHPEGGAGMVESFKIKGDTLLLINQRSSGGADPCFVTINESGYVLTANYTGGNVGLLKLNKNGSLTDLLDVEQHTGSGTTDRQEGPHAHSTWFTADGNNVISVDLGTNELWFSQIDSKQEKLVPNDPQKLAMRPGAGPRHLAFHPNGNWIYVINELDNTIDLVQKGETGLYEAVAFFPTLPLGYSEPSFCADIHISSDGKFLYASNRGHNSIAIFSINESDGFLQWAGHENVQGKWPRNFSISPDGNFLLVANQHSNNIVSFKRDKDNGYLEFVDQIEAPSPVCILFD
ncbi:MAG: lactonase family protein [Saprospiraceae bacterium]|nr:lactonase family protein [Saprospiraceae bacterium]MCB9325014.1 lactonase family protein [Lewinellaceae bacterium]